MSFLAPDIHIGTLWNEEGLYRGNEDRKSDQGFHFLLRFPYYVPYEKLFFVVEPSEIIFLT